MHTEDDTFAKLKRVSLNEMGDLFGEWAKGVSLRPDQLFLGVYGIERDEFFHSHGWTVEEYRLAINHGPSQL